jgi:anti-sigma factor RsiW
MTSEHCREWRSQLGEAALGRIEPADDLALRAHLDGCPECRAELRELTSVARALPKADLSHVSASMVEPTPALAMQVRGRLAAQRSEQRSQRRRRLVGALAIAAAVIVALTTFALVRPTSAGGEHVALGSPVHGVSATATLRARDEGTQVRMHVAGLDDDGDVYWLWLTDAAGKRVAAGTFRGTNGQSNLVMTAGLPLSSVRRVWVTEGESQAHVVLDSHL